MIVSFARVELGLELKQQPFINRTRLGMDFLGMRIFPDAIRLGRASRIRYRRRLRGYDEAFRRGELDELEYQSRVTALTAFTDNADARGWRKRIWAACEEQRATTVSCAGAAGTTTPGTAAPRAATGTIPATATTTTASACPAPSGNDPARTPAPVRLVAQWTPPCTYLR